MKSNTFFYIAVLTGSIISLFVSFWFLPFILAIPVSYYFEVSLKKSMWLHFGIYALACACYCAYAYSTGSKELVAMIGEIFKGLSFVSLLLISSVLFGITAMMGAWVGGKLRMNN
jgi:hypothetical protein